ncbi:MAG TPA: YceI family protein [Gemmatimonadales bacterium]|nr:YceI family protein [Gemmatimonadales bacterium]
MPFPVLLIALASQSSQSPQSPQSPVGDSVVYTLTPASRLEVHTGKAGLLGFAGHEHVIRARAFTGHLSYHRAAPDRSHIDLVIPTDSLEVLTPPDTEEIRKVTAAMRTETLDVPQYPRITFVSRSITWSGSKVHLLGALTIRNVTRDVPVNAQVVIDGDTLRASTTFVVKQTAFGIKPYRGGPGGTVRVADDVTFDIRIVAARKL